jgi:hypothetical protein
MDSLQVGAGALYEGWHGSGSSEAGEGAGKGGAVEGAGGGARETPKCNARAPCHRPTHPAPPRPGAQVAVNVAMADGGAVAQPRLPPDGELPGAPPPAALAAYKRLMTVRQRGAGGRGGWRAPQLPGRGAAGGRAAGRAGRLQAAHVGAGATGGGGRGRARVGTRRCGEA